MSTAKLLHCINIYDAAWIQREKEKGKECVYVCVCFLNGKRAIYIFPHVLNFNRERLVFVSCKWKAVQDDSKKKVERREGAKLKQLCANSNALAARA